MILLANYSKKTYILSQLHRSRIFTNTSINIINLIRFKILANLYLLSLSHSFQSQTKCMDLSSNIHAWVNSIDFKYYKVEVQTFLCIVYLYLINLFGTSSYYENVHSFNLRGNIRFRIIGKCFYIDIRLII